MHPAAPDHRRDDLDVRKHGGGDRERVAVEDDQVGEVAGEELPAATLVVGLPGGLDRCRGEGLLDRNALILPPVQE